MRTSAAPRRTRARNRPGHIGVLGLLLGVVVLASCQTVSEAVAPPPPNFGAIDDKLAAAGFIMKPANTQQRQAMLLRIPQHQFLTRQKDFTIHYVYADDAVCICLYVGTQQAFDQFKANQVQQQLIDERQLIALTWSDPAWSWGAWGPWDTTVTEVDFSYGESGW